MSIPKIALFAFALICIPVGLALSFIPYGESPDWESDETGYNDVSTGGFLADVDGDGWLDLVVGNGNDISSQTDCIYFNDEGVLETVASWRTDDDDYTGHIDMGDLNNDGWVDLVTSIFWNGDVEEYQDQVYLNSDGTLSSTPTFYTAEYDNTFGVALGDYDNDGYLDIALAQGNRYIPSNYKFIVYHNDGDGTFTKGWESDDEYYGNDVEFGDFDNDGWLDLACACDLEPNIVFYNSGGSFPGTPDWESTEERGSLQLDIGDIDGDGWLDLVAADNEQLSPYPSKVRAYMNNSGFLETTASWQNADESKDYYSVAVLVDCDNDGYNELATCGWWEPLEIYDNVGGILETTPSWTYSVGLGSLVGEDIVFGDTHNASLNSETDTFDGDGSRQLFYLNHTHLHSIDEVSVEEVSLPISDYCYDLQHGWLVLKTAPPSGTENVSVEYTYSASLDMAYTNWTSYASNYMWYYMGDVPVELLYFTAVSHNSGVMLSWEVSDFGEEPLLGFNLYRTKIYAGEKQSNITENVSKTSVCKKLNQELITGQGAYHYLDDQTEVDTHYLYSLEAVYESYNNTVASAEATSGVGAESFYLAQSYPNPTTGRTTFKFSLGGAQNGGELTIYDLSGRLMAQFTLEADQSELLWDGFDAQGNRLASGVYIYSLTAKGNSSARKLVLYR